MKRRTFLRHAGALAGFENRVCGMAGGRQGFPAVSASHAADVGCFLLGVKMGQQGGLVGADALNLLGRQRALRGVQDEPAAIGQEPNATGLKVGD